VAGGSYYNTGSRNIVSMCRLLSMAEWRILRRALTTNYLELSPSEKPTVHQPLEKIPAFYGTPRFISASIGLYPKPDESSRPPFHVSRGLFQIQDRTFWFFKAGEFPLQFNYCELLKKNSARRNYIVR
jgi:hypothetical protein